MLFLFLLLSFNSYAENPSCAIPPNPGGLREVCAYSTPVCIPEVAGAEKIATAMNDSKNKVSDDELFTRLIFAESLASGCDLSNDSIYENIAWTLKNRLARKDFYGNGSVRGVVLKPSQFSSSTGSCDVAKRSEFFCPTHSKEFEEAWVKAFKAWKKTKTEENPIPTSRHYFFPHHFDKSKEPKCAKWKGVLPAWAKKENAVKNIPNCATFYNVNE